MLRMILLYAALAAIAVASSSLSRARAADTSGVGVAVRKDVAYFEGKDADPVRHRLDLYLPEGKKSFPLLLFIHGGAWRNGSKDLYLPLGQTFARQGIGVAVANYRLSPGVRHPEHVRDVARAFAWVVKNARDLGADPGRLYVSGHSAGGHLVTLLALDPRYLRAEGLDVGTIRGVVGISGPYALGAKGFENVFGEEGPARTDAFPLSHVKDVDGKKLPLFLLLYADKDYAGLPLSAQTLKGALEQRGVRVMLKEIADRDHITIISKVPQPDDATAKEIAQFVLGH